MLIFSDLLAGLLRFWAAGLLGWNKGGCRIHPDVPPLCLQMHKIGKLFGRGGVIAVEVGGCVLVLHPDHKWNQDIIGSLEASKLFISEVGALEIERELCFIIIYLFCHFLSHLLFTLLGAEHISIHLKWVLYVRLRGVTNPRDHRLRGVFFLILSALKILFVFIILVLGLSIIIAIT